MKNGRPFARILNPHVAILYKLKTMTTASTSYTVVHQLRR